MEMNGQGQKKQFETPQILFEDRHVLVAVKEPNLLTQGDISGDMDMLSLLKRYIVENENKPGDAYLGLVHRMDRPAGGLLVFAKTSKAAGRLSEQLREHSMHREYICVVKGDPPPSFTLKHILLKDNATNMVKQVPAYLRVGKEAVLHAKTIARKNGTALLAVRLETGRAHQIRAQMAFSGFPLLGDKRYGGEDAQGQLALWGMHLSFHHPISKQKMVFIAAPTEIDIGQGKKDDEKKAKVQSHWMNYKENIKGLALSWPSISETVPLER